MEPKALSYHSKYANVWSVLSRNITESTTSDIFQNKREKWKENENQISPHEHLQHYIKKLDTYDSRAF